MNLAFRLHQIRVGGLSLSLRKSLRKLGKNLRAARTLTRIQKYPTTLPLEACTPLRRVFETSDIASFRPYLPELRDCCAHYLRHEFAIAGRGWTHYSHREAPSGMGGYRYSQEAFPYEIDATGEWIAYIINAKNVAESQRVWSLIQQPYEAIDWQRDLRSGYSWAEGVHTQFISTGAKGADPKTPWDLGRLHMLLHIAIVHSLSDIDSEREILYQCFRSIVLDFIALNPPGFGIQWLSPMDVGIRLANMLVAYDIIRCTRDADEELDRVISRSVHEHTRYVVNHREWSDGMRANHFLANLAALAASSAYMEDCSLRREVVEVLEEHLHTETLYQFTRDGGNFEASLPYHRLSAEMLFWSWGFACLDPTLAACFVEQTREAMEAIASFTINTCSRSAQISQIGDNDSGRFLAFRPFHWSPADSDRPLDIRHLLNLCEAWTGQRESQNDQGDFLLMRALRARRSQATQDGRIRAERQSSSYAAPDFGLWRMSSEGMDVFVRAGSIGQNAKGGHAHNDQLSLCLFVNGLEFFCDAGTYVYTPLHDQRNRFRSTSMHNCLQPEGLEQNSWMEGSSEMLFWLSSNRALPHVVESSERRWSARHEGYGQACERELEFKAKALVIRDRCAVVGLKHVRFHCRPECSLEVLDSHRVQVLRQGIAVVLQSHGSPLKIEESVYSPEYGAILASKCLVIEGTEQEFFSSVTVVHDS